MRTARAMEDKRLVYEIPVQHGAKQAQEKATAELRFVQAQEEDTVDPKLAQAQGSAEEEWTQHSTVVHRKRQAVPIQEKALLTMEEAAEYTGLGLHKLREISSAKHCPFILFNGNKRMFKRRKLDEYLEDAYSI